MNSGYIYAVVAFVAVLELLMILNRSVRTHFKVYIDRDFVFLLKFFTVFCLIDCFWGICDAKPFFVNHILFNVVTYAYHVMCALSAFVWVGYIIKYLGLKGGFKVIPNIFRSLFLTGQVVLLVLNFFTHEGFYLDVNLDYSTGYLRDYMYFAQFSYYIFLIICSVIGFCFNHSNKIMTERNRNVILFSLVPLVFGIGQFLFYDVAMYSMGFMLSAFIIYAFNLTEIREKHLARIADDSNIVAFQDVLSGLLNRRAYEEALKLLQSVPTVDNLCYVSMDLNELKKANDELGHEAGDELINGVSEIMKTVFQKHGQLYRTGGDEFACIIKADYPEVIDMKMDFEKRVSKWKGNKVHSMHVSTGYVFQSEFPDKDIIQIAKLADERMYNDKARYYASKGVDRRGQSEAFSALCTLYTKILKVNFTTDTYQIIKMEEMEKKSEKGFSKHISKWLHDFGVSGQVHKDDLDFYLEKSDVSYLKEYFLGGKTSISIPYRRLIGEQYQNCIMEMTPAGDYSDSNQSVFLYVKVLN